MKLSELELHLDIDNLCIAGYNNCGLLVYQNGILRLLLDCVKRGGEPEFSKMINLETCPALPKSTVISSILVCSGGSKIALVGPNGCWILRVNSQLWAQSAVHVEHWAQLLQTHYFCEATPLQPSVWSGRCNQKIVKFVPSSASLSQQHHIAVLSEDSVIRVYNVDIDVNSPVYIVDFSSFISHGANKSGLQSNTYGLVNRIVSFCVCVSSTLSPTLVTIDIDGGLYSCEMDLDGIEVYEPQVIESPQCIPCDSVDLFYLPHPLSHLFSVLGVIGSDGTVTHLTAIPDDRGSFDVCAHDQLVIPGGAANGNGTVTVQSDARGSYVLSTERAMYYINCSPWISRYSLSLESDVDVSSFPQSTINEIAQKTRQSVENKENLSSSSSLSVYTLPSTAVLSARDPDGSSSVIYVYPIEGSLMAAFVKHISYIPLPSLSSTPSSNTNQLSSSDQYTKQLESLISSSIPLPVVNKAALQTEEDRLAFLDKSADIILQNTRMERNAVQMSLSRVQALFEFQKMMQNQRTVFDTRLCTAMNTISRAREQLDVNREKLMALESRIDRVISNAFTGVPLSIEEEKQLKALKQHQRDLEQMSTLLPKLLLDIQDHRRSVTGPVKAFTSSATSKRQNAQRCIVEVDCLQEKVDDLEKRVEKL